MPGVARPLISVGYLLPPLPTRARKRAHTPATQGTKNIFSASYFGLHGARRNYAEQIRKIVRIGNERLGVRPIIFGECGIPMDINEKRAFATGDYTQHTRFLDTVLNGMEVGGGGVAPTPAPP